MSTKDHKLGGQADHLQEILTDSVTLLEADLPAYGLEVKQILHNYRQVKSEGLTKHLIGVWLGQPLAIKGRIGGKFHQKTQIKGDIVFAPAGTSYEAEYGEVSKNILFLHINSDSVERVALELNLNPSKIELIPEMFAKDSTLEHIGYALKNEVENNFAAGSLCTEYLSAALVSRLLTNYNERPILIKHYDEGLSKQKTRRVIEYINAHLHETLTVAQIAQVVGVSAFHFARLFKKSIGSSPYQYVLRQRIEAAKKLLRETELPITEICFLSGFTTPSQFASNFRRLVGVTPRKFRATVC